VFGDNKTLSMYDSRQKEVVEWFQTGQRRSTSMHDQPIQSHFEHWPYPGVTAVTVRRLFVFVTGVGAAQFNNELLYITDMQQCETDS